MHTKNNNPFNIYTSKVKRVNIPLPAFQYFHRASSEEKVDEKFIGRERSSKRLYAWLTDEATQSGSYLVTGYRGMGKSSFVGRVLFELCIPVNYKTTIAGYFCFTLLWASIITGIAGIYWDSHTTWMNICCSILMIAILSFPYNNYFRNSRRKVIFVCRVMKRRFKLTWTAHRTAFRTKGKTEWEKINKELYDTDISKKSYGRICININLGQEILNEKDILSLVAHQLYIKYNAYIQSPVANIWHWLIQTGIALAGVCLFCMLPLEIVKEANLNPLSRIIDGQLFYLIYMSVGFVLFFVLYRYISQWFIFSQKRPLRKLKLLMERIDAQIELEKSAGVSMALKDEKMGWDVGLTNGRKKNTKFPQAETRVIEQELIDIISSINQTFKSPHFIFVFDELDKIEAEEKRNFNNLEYTNEKNFPGKGTSRTRKQNVLHVLANMKLFISTAKAKFIFIAGRELYDAYLADLSDREFAISSIFNGVIYVESFCSNERREKDIMLNAETYICKQLIPQKVITSACIEHYINAKSMGKDFEHLDINLKMYYKYLINSYLKRFNNNPDLLTKDIRDCIDKVIILLYHFSVYLYHISNGSPKKMSLYFEKYIRPLNSENQLTLKKWDVKEKILENKSIDIRIDSKAKYCLSFGYIDQRIIGFIHYISFPVTQIIINANQFGDKLLLSASFLINHIYKFHKSGFSWRNMEHTPELLEVYRIPEFRGFINSILSYLAQSHIIPVTCGLYQFKFRKRISEEISLASKFSEEIAALFNFTLDESLSVKQHYINLLEYYSNPKEPGIIENPHVVAGMHVILADLFMADEEYTKAIFEYQTGINIMMEEERISANNNENLTDQHAITRMLFLLRNMLKLGLAFEKRKTYESAYVTYNELIGRLIAFRYLDEQSLGLNYAIKTKNNEHEAVLYVTNKRKNVPYVRKNVCPEINNSLDKQKTMYSVNGPDIIVDFAHQMTLEKNLIIQRLSMLEDIRLIYQAMLARLFVLEKMELGGITRANIELLESEYVFLHLATNEKNKFLISNDFFRRLGDIMFYKNGLTMEFYQDSKGNVLKNCFMEGLYLWSYNIRTEIMDYCNEYKCYNQKDFLLETMYKIQNPSSQEEWAEMPVDFKKCETAKSLPENFINKVNESLKDIPIRKVTACNNHRKLMWENNKRLPCFACKYYNKSLRLLMKNLFNVDLERECTNHNCSKVYVILSCLTENYNSKSLRQNFMIQLAEVLDCMGNVMLSCTSNISNESSFQCKIRNKFLQDFLHDVSLFNNKESKDEKSDIRTCLKLLHNLKTMETDNSYMLEKTLVLYWEAFLCFRMGNDLKKAAGSLKKILQTIQKYLKLNENNQESKNIVKLNLNAIKNKILKPCLVNLYAYYNFINIIEIQKLKWIFHVQMYENISLNRLSMFPDIEEIMLVYYEVMACCIVDYARERKKDKKNIINNDYKIKLSSIYKNIALGALRLESTIYERVLSLQFKAMMNQRILFHLLKKNGVKNPDCFYDKDFNRQMINFLNSYLGRSEHLDVMLGEYRSCFKEVITSCEENPNSRCCNIKKALLFLEFLISDTMYCLTRILEIITPYTSTTLFTNTFMGDIYQMLYKWNLLFDLLYMVYRASENEFSITEVDSNQINQIYPEWETGLVYTCTRNKCKYQENHNLTDNNCPLYDFKCKYKKSEMELIYDILNEPDSNLQGLKNNLNLYRECMNLDIAEQLFDNMLKSIGKSNIHYTLRNYSAEMALKCYRQALDMHHEGKSYKDMIAKMYYLDDDLKNDTIQFDLALERLRINNGYIDKNLQNIMKVFNNASIYDVENFCADNETKLSLKNRFPDFYAG